jgi:hypothetical protein
MSIGITGEHWLYGRSLPPVCGADPEESTSEGDIANVANPNSRTRPPWVNVYHQAVSAIKAGNLGEVNGEVTPAKFIAWVRGKGWGVPTELLAMADDQVAIKAESAQRKTYPPGNHSTRGQEGAPLGRLKAVHR